MAFKMKGKPTIQGTKQHYKELKVAREATDNLPDGRSKSSPFQAKANPYAEAKKKDPNLDKYIKIQKSTKPGSDEYEANQAKINAAYGKVRSKTLKAAQIKKVEEKESIETPKKEVAPVVKEKVYDPHKGVTKTKYQIKQEKTIRKDIAKGKDTPGGEDITRAERADIKAKKLRSKKDTALSEGKYKKGYRIWKRANKADIKAEKLKAKAEAKERGGGKISAADRRAIKTQKLKSKKDITPVSKKSKRLAKRIKRREDKAASDKIYVGKDKPEVTIKG